MYDGEKRLTRALQKMAKSAGSDELHMAFTNHLAETEQQVSRLEQVFRALGETPRGKKCDGIIGIVEEGKKAMEELDGPLLDAALIAGAQKVEHYEIASYGALAYMAGLLGHDEAKSLLGETLDEEKAADEKLSEIAESKVNREALLHGNQRDEGGSSMRDLREGMGSRSLAQDRPSPRRARRGGSIRRGSRSSRSRS